ncbi:MAG: hypothetical protein Q8O68_00020 [Candidatus Daviesbacteria bacterium]|nr:hypothetical protein [Candidatus Daviesbacteria bacterium]
MPLGWFTFFERTISFKKPIGLCAPFSATQTAISCQEASLIALKQLEGYYVGKIETVSLKKEFQLGNNYSDIWLLRIGLISSPIGRKEKSLTLGIGINDGKVKYAYFE